MAAKRARNVPLALTKQLQATAHAQLVLLVHPDLVETLLEWIALA